MKLEKLDELLKQFPHWYDKNPYSNFYRLMKVLNNQRLDKYHKIKSLDFSRRLTKPLQVHKEQEEPYKYIMEFTALVDNIKEVNVYVNPLMNNNEEIIMYEKCLTQHFKDDGYNDFFHQKLECDTRQCFSDNSIQGWDDDFEYVPRQNIIFSCNNELGKFGFTPNFLTEEQTNEGLLVSNNTDSGRTYWASISPITRLASDDFHIPFTIDCDIVKVTGNPSIRLYHEDTDAYSEAISVDLTSLELNNGGHLQIIFDGEKAIFIVNGETRQTVTKDIGETVSIRFYLPSNSSVIYKNFKVSVEATRNYPEPIPKYNEIIPSDTYIMEVITYDDYRWVKGYPENDSTDLYSIYREKKSYTEYLTFLVAKKNIKRVQILKNGEVIFDKELYKLIQSEDGKIIYHDYQPQKKIEEYNDVLTTDVEDKVYKFQTILHNNDLETVFDYTPLKTIYPNTDDYIYDENVQASEDTINTLLIVKENDRYNAYKTVKDDYGYTWQPFYKDIPYTTIPKDTYDLKIYLYDKYKPNCEEEKYLVMKRYNGYELTNFDCFEHDQSLDMLGRYWNVPRLSFITKQPTSDPVEYYSKTLPLYYNKLTEDDWHYQKRLKQYIYEYNNTHFPVLELWKNYGMSSTLFNRKDILSRMGESYICEEIDFFEDNTIEVDTDNKLTIKKGESNSIVIDGHEWFESVICSNLFIVPSSKYRIELQTDDDELAVHIYYLNLNGDCTHQEKINLSYDDDYGLMSFITPENSCKMDIVLESDNPFKYDEARLVKVNKVNEEPMFMTTKNDYNSCVYELKANYSAIPSNVDFSNNKVFEKLLQRSLPLSHKGFLNIDYDTGETNETILIKESMKCGVVNCFDETNNKGEGQTQYKLDTLEQFIREGCHYKLEVTFTNEDIENLWDNNEGVIKPTLIFRQNWEDTNPVYVELDNIKCNNETTIVHYFTGPSNMNLLDLQFDSTLPFTYKDLSLKRTEELTLEELCRIVT